jgi:hypothetical protein
MSQYEDGTMEVKAHYLLWMSQNKFISICGNTLLKFIPEEWEEAIYCSIIAYATPYVSNEEQNVLILMFHRTIKMSNLKLRRD